MTASTWLSANAHQLQTHNVNDSRMGWLVMVVAALCCTGQSRTPNIDRYAPEIWRQPLTLTHDLDPDLWNWPNSDVKNTNSGIWPWHLTYDPDLLWQSQPSQGQGRPTYRISRSPVASWSNSSVVRMPTDAQTDGRTESSKRIISLLR